MRFLRIITSILVLVVLVGILAAAALIWLIDPNKIKPALIAEVRDQTGYILNVDGNLSWSFYPRVSIKVAHATLKNPSESKPFLEVTNLKIGSDLSQLIHGQLNWGTNKNSGIKAEIFVDQLRLSTLNASNVSADLLWQNKILTLNPIKASLYDGAITGTMHGKNFSNSATTWDWNVTLGGVQVQKLLKDLTPNSKINIVGVGAVKLQGSTSGNDRAQLINNLNGNIDFSLNNGALDGVDINHWVRVADALMNKGDLPTDGTNQTTFSSLTGTAVIKNGVAQTNNLLLNSTDFTTTGNGNVNLLSQQIKLNLLVKPQQNIRTQWQIPLDVTGTLSKPNIALDKNETQKFLAQQGLDKLKEKATEKAGDFLQKLLDR